jgi:hypothetical protein
MAKHGTDRAYRGGCRCDDCRRWRRERAAVERANSLKKYGDTKKPKNGPILIRHRGDCDCLKCDDYDRGMRVITAILEKGTAPFLLKIDEKMSTTTAPATTGDAMTATPTGRTNDYVYPPRA